MVAGARSSAVCARLPDLSSAVAARLKYRQPPERDDREVEKVAALALGDVQEKTRRARLRGVGGLFDPEPRPAFAGRTTTRDPKSRSIARFFFTNLGARAESAQNAPSFQFRRQRVR
jgi:hypothetical protein